MHQLPVELWAQVFSSACTDDGCTGRSLALVSKDFYELSKGFRLQSLAIVGKDQILACAGMLELTPTRFRRVRNLFISNYSPARNHPETYEQAQQDAE